jgi:N-acetylmuramoyl-L-alanine amidase
MKAKPAPLLCLFSLACLLTQAYGQAATAATQNPPADMAGLAKAWSANWSFDALNGSGYIVRGHDLVRFRLGYPAYIAGSSLVIRAPAPVWNGANVELPRDAIKALQLWFDERDAERASKASVVAILIDPGHGGKDPGAIGEFGSGAKKFRIAEKDVVLSIAKDLQKRLSERWPDKQILITRSGDSYPSLDERVEMANKVELSVNQAIIYISIHANASFNKNASGYEVWYLNPEYRRTVVDAKKAEGVDKDVLPILNAMLEEEYTTESVFLARSILDGISASIGPSAANRGLRAEEWFVVRNARMPSVLVEVGFVTNEAEARLLADEGHLRKLGDGIYNGVLSFVDYFERRRSASAP